MWILRNMPRIIVFFAGCCWLLGTGCVTDRPEGIREKVKKLERDLAVQESRVRAAENVVIRLRSSDVAPGNAGAQLDEAVQSLNSEETEYRRIYEELKAAVQELETSAQEHH